MSQNPEFESLMHKYWAFWKSKDEVFKVTDLLLLLVTSGGFIGWLIGEMIIVGIGWESNEGVED